MEKGKAESLNLCRHCGECFFNDGGVKEKKGFICILCKNGGGRMGDD